MRRIKCLTAVDDFTNEAMGILVDHEISGVRGTRALDEMARFHGDPAAVRTDKVSNTRGRLTGQSSDPHHGLAKG